MSTRSELEKLTAAAAENGNLARLKYLVLNEGVDINLQDQQNNSLLYKGIGSQKSEIVEWLLDNGADPDSKTIFHHSCLHRAADIGSPEIVDLLLAAGANPNVTTVSGYELPLCKVANVKEARYIIHSVVDVGMNLWQVDGEGNNLLQIAIERDCEHVKKPVEEYMALPQLTDDLSSLTRKKLFTPDENGKTLLDQPQTWHHWDDVLAALAKKGEKISKADLLQDYGNGKTGLMRAAECRVMPTVVRALNAQGESVGAEEILSGDGLSPLGELCMRKGAVAGIFTQANWVGRGSELKQVMKRLPPKATKQIPQRHSLLAVCSQKYTVGMER